MPSQNDLVDERTRHVQAIEQLKQGGKEREEYDSSILGPLKSLFTGKDPSVNGLPVDAEGPYGTTARMAQEDLLHNENLKNMKTSPLGQALQAPSAPPAQAAPAAGAQMMPAASESTPSPPVDNLPTTAPMPGAAPASNPMQDQYMKAGASLWNKLNRNTNPA